MSLKAFHVVFVTASVLLSAGFSWYELSRYTDTKVAMDMWLGIGSQSRLAFSVFISIFPIIIATTAGLSAADPNAVRLCRSLTASEWQIFTNIRFPSALPYIFSGMKIGITLSIIGVIIGEFITSQRGLGYLIIFATSRADTVVAMAAIVVLCASGLLLYGAVALAEKLTDRRYGVPRG